VVTPAVLEALGFSFHVPFGALFVVELEGCERLLVLLAALAALDTLRRFFKILSLLDGLLIEDAIEAMSLLFESRRDSGRFLLQN
jgi:hypothetical protein